MNGTSSRLRPYFEMLKALLLVLCIRELMSPVVFR